MYAKGTSFSVRLAVFDASLSISPESVSMAMAHEDYPTGLEFRTEIKKKKRKKEETNHFSKRHH